MPAKPAIIQHKLALRSRARDQSGGSSRGLVELPTRPQSEYTFERLLCALQSVNGGNLAEAADLTRASITGLGYPSGVLDTITGGTLGLPRTFEGGDTRIHKALEAGDYERMIPTPVAKRIMAWGAALGVGLGQFIDPRDPPRLVPPHSAHLSTGGQAVPLTAWPRPADNITRTLVSWDPRFLRYRWETDSWYLLTANKGEIRIVPGDGEWLMYTPYGDDRPWEYGAWRFLALDFTVIHNSLFDRARHSEVAQPVRVGKVPQGTTDRQRETYAKQIEAMRKFSWFVLPDGIEYGIVEATGKSSIDVYKDQIAWGERDITIGLTGNAPIVEGGKGFGNNEVYERVTASKRAGYAGTWSTCVSDHGILPYTIDNYGIPSEPTRVIYQTAPPEDQKAAIERLGAFGDVCVKLREGLDKFGLESDPASIIDMAQALGIRVRVKPEASTPAGQIVVTPSALEAVVRADEVRQSQGLPPFGDERGGKTIAELFGETPEQSPPLAFSASSAPWGGLPVHEQYAPGDVRSGAGPDGEPWSIEMTCGYGFIVGMMGNDGEPLDCYIGPDDHAPMAFLIEQLTEDGEPDEGKIMLGWRTAEDAVAAYLAHVPAWCLGRVAAVPIGEIV